MQKSKQNSLNKLALISFLVAMVLPSLSLFLINMMILKSVSVYYILAYPLISMITIIANAIALHRSKKNKQRGRGLAIGGIIVSSLAAILGVIFSLMMISLTAA